MAQALLAESKLRLVFEVGMDQDGEPILQSKTFSNIKKEATADQLYQAAQAIFVLRNDILSRVERVDNSDLLS
jgi:hypothetical protein